MRNRFVLVPDQTGQRREEVVVIDDDLVRVRADRRGHLARVVELAERTLLEGDGERLQRPVDHPRHQRRDGAAVEPAREEHPERHIGHQPNPHGVLEGVAELLHQVAVSGGRHMVVARAGGNVPGTAGC